MKNFNPFAGIGQFLMFCFGTALFIVEFVWQVIKCGHFEWWQLLMVVMLALLIMALRISWKEYKDDK